MSVALVLVAAGAGRRLGRDHPKALVEVAGRSLLAHALERVRRVTTVDELVVVHAPSHEDAFATACQGFEVDALVAGGRTRADSVRCGVEAISGSTATVAIHDAARAFTPATLMDRVISAVAGDVIAAAPGIAVPDTLKRVDGDRVVETVPRDDLWAVQTPQAIRRDALEAALELAADLPVTDDLALIEAARNQQVVSGDIVLVPGSVRATKITYDHDLQLAALFAQESPA